MPFAHRDECDLYYEVHGSGPPLVLASGLGGTSSWWAPQVARYAQEFTTLIFDQRGTGQSSRVPVASVEQMSADLVAILDAAGLDRVHLLGHSTGGAIGTATALDHPSRIASLMIYASTTCGDAYRHRVLGLRRMLMERVGMDAYARYTTLLLYPPYWINANDARIAAEEAAAAASLGSAAVQGSRLDAILAFDRRAEYGRLDIPVRILCTEDDILTPRYFSEEMAQLIPGATAIYPPRGGHAFSRTEPALFDEIALPFFREVSRA
ncbi:alpha/beta fold hydrolase [Roseomonas harenae]|jgi:aminoacrylate hydrolase|uniref:alpha/beta fold hydrolase n=1 Tax=Muricoccus harenae TaxID=2692566 RepID=UPI001331A9FB|nr:alpha/beta hydrolase [Roseomonas harenae]